MATLARSIRHVNDHLSTLLPDQAVIDAADAAGHRWRRRKLGPVQTVLLLILQVLSANASLAQARALGGYRTSLSALCKARMRLPHALLLHLLGWQLDHFLPCRRRGGARTYLLDCSNAYLQDTPSLRKRYRRPRQKRRRCDYPQIRSLCLFDLDSGMLVGEHPFASDRHESPMLKFVLPVLRRGDTLIVDRGFVSYANFCLLRDHGVHVIARLAKNLHAKAGGRRTRTARLGKRDHRVRWLKPPQPTTGFDKKQWQGLTPELQLRQLTFSCASRGGGRSRSVTIVTTLLDARRHPPQKLAERYRRRWEVETDFRHLKKTLGLEMLRSRSEANVRRELLIRTIAYNLVRIVMMQAATQKQTTCDRISFADACRWLLLDAQAPLRKLLSNPRRDRRPRRPRKLKYRGKNYRLLTSRPSQRMK